MLLLSASAIAFGIGLLFFIDREFAWALLETDARFMGTQLQRRAGWKTQIMWQGMALMVLGVIGMLLAFGVLPR